MLLSLAILLCISPTVTAQTDLQAKCTGTDRLYSGTSCYVVVGTAKTHNEAKTSCNHYLGNSGHLVNIKSSAAQSAVRTLITNYPTTTVTYVWTCLELLNSSVATNVISNWGNYFRGGTLVAKPVYLPWYTTEPQLSATSNRVVYSKTSNYIHSVPSSSAYSYVCEYEEELKEPVVTDLEQKCVNLTSSFKTLFLNDICYVAHPETKNYNDAKASCNDLNGYVGYLAHIRAMNELWVAEALRSVANVPYMRLGIEQTDLSSTDAFNGWYLTTPTNQSILTTYLPWATSNPVTGQRTIAVTTGYPNSFAAVDSNTAYPFLCQYVATTTELRTQCSGADRLYTGASCIVVVESPMLTSKAKTLCNHYLGYAGHMAHIRNAVVQAAVRRLITTYKNYMGNTWTGMELMNQSVATTNNNNWGTYYRNGTFIIATYLPWNPSEPQSSSIYNRVAFSQTSGNIYTAADGTRYPTCEYEEALKQPVTDLEQKCVNLTSSFYTSFVNGICYVMHPETKTYNDAKMACNDLSDHKGHLVHVRTIGELWVADALRAAAGVTYARIGIEQTNLSSTDPTTGWYLTKPTNPSVLTTYLPWVTAPTTGMRTIAVTTGYPKTFNAVANTTLYPFICQYGPTTLSATTGEPASYFYHYSFGYFSDPSYILNQSTLPRSMCIYTCYANELCYGYSYNTGNSDCHLLAVIPSAYSSQLTADKQYETVIRDLQ